MKALSDLGENQVLIISVCTWAITQALKVIVILVQEKRIAWNYFITSGGMPSAHSATVCSLATSIAMTVGIGSIYFAIAAILAVIVMYDAAGVRQSVGEHSIVLNRIIKEIGAKKFDFEKDMREIVGHTPFQVIVGAIIGILIAWIWVTIT
jgi:uncharacterized protein